nr:PREDICTED: protein kintoun [Apteryx mantelli mantelli]
MAGAGQLEDLDLSAEEVERLQRAFRDEQFRALLADYAAELVPGILPQSLRGDLGAHHYRLRFSSCAGAYALFLQFPPENSLAPAEASVDVSAHNAAITLAKAPGSTGPWEKLCFGLDASVLQERLFVSEENVDRFLSTVLCPSFCKESVPERQPLIEVLDVTEDKSQIRLQQPREAARSEQGGKAQTVNGPGGDRAEKRNDADLQPETETNCAAADTVEEQHATETTATSTSFVPAETIGKIGCSSHHCLQLEPSDTSSAIPGKAKGSEPDVDCAFTTTETAVSADSDKQAGLHSEGQAKTKGGDAAACAEPAQANQRGSDCRPASPLNRTKTYLRRKLNLTCFKSAPLNPSTYHGGYAAQTLLREFSICATLPASAGPLRLGDEGSAGPRSAQRPSISRSGDAPWAAARGWARLCSAAALTL